jgi:hypothetical protein
MQLWNVQEVQKPHQDAHGESRQMNCESNGKPLCQNGWQYRHLDNAEKERVPCRICRPTAHASYFKKWKPSLEEPEERPEAASKSDKSAAVAAVVDVRNSME